MKQKKEYIKYATYLVLGFFIFAILHARGTYFYKLGIGADLALMFIVSISMFEDGAMGGICGFVYALLLTSQKGIFPLGIMLFYILVGVLTGHAINIDFRKHIISAEIFTGIACSIYVVLGYLFMGVFLEYPMENVFFDWLKFTSASLIVGIPIYYTVRHINKVFNEE